MGSHLTEFEKVLAARRRAARKRAYFRGYQRARRMGLPPEPGDVGHHDTDPGGWMPHSDARNKRLLLLPCDRHCAMCQDGDCPVHERAA